jgi:hypothetical protein
VSLRSIMIYSNESLRAGTGGRQHVRTSREPNLTTLNPRPWDPEFALVRGDPRVKALRKKVGLPD